MFWIDFEPSENWLEMLGNSTAFPFSDLPASGIEDRKVFLKCHRRANAKD